MYKKQGGFSYCQKSVEEDIYGMICSPTYYLSWTMLMQLSIPFTTYLSIQVVIECQDYQRPPALHKYVNITGIFQTFQNDRAFLHPYNI